MTFLHVFSLIVLLLTGGIALLAVIGASMEKKFVGRCKSLLKNLDAKYESFIKKHIAVNVLESGKTDRFDEFIEDVMVVIKPELDALADHVARSDSGGVTINYPSRYFNNVVSWVEVQLRRREDRTTPDEDTYALIDSKELENLYGFARDAVNADLEMRELDFKMGNI